MNKEIYTILLVDDFSAIIESIVSFFEDSEYPYSFLMASSGEAAIGIAKESKPDLILMDWQMPGLSGIETVAILKTIPETADIPIIMASGIMLSSENLKTALEAGASDFIRKPMDKIELIARINATLALSQSVKQLKLQQVKLEAAAKTLHQLANATLEGIILHKDFTIIEVNKQACDILNYTKDDLESLSLVSLISNQNIPELAKQIYMPVESLFEIELLDSKKDPILVHIRSKELEFNGEPVKCLAFVDITEVKKQKILILEQEKALAENKQMELQHKLEAIRKDITGNALLRAQFNEKNRALLDEIRIIIPKPGVEIKRALHDLIIRYKSEAPDTLWKEFELRFKEVHPDFYKIIKIKHPELTPGEIRLCSLLKLNLMSKEIASITQQNPQSINVARSRIRKKLNLENDDNLTDYLAFL